jgi:hypothetical protein
LRSETTKLCRVDFDIAGSTPCVRCNALKAVSYHSMVLLVTFFQIAALRQKLLKQLRHRQKVHWHSFDPLSMRFLRGMFLGIKNIGAPCRTRTCDLLVRSQTLYPTELRALLRPDETLTVAQRSTIADHADRRGT